MASSLKEVHRLGGNQIAMPTGGASLNLRYVGQVANEVNLWIHNLGGSTLLIMADGQGLPHGMSPSVGGSAMSAATLCGMYTAGQYYILPANDRIVVPGPATFFLATVTGAVATQVQLLYGFDPSRVGEYP